MIHVHAPVYISEVILKGVPQLFVTFINVLLNLQCNRKLCKPYRLNANDIGGKCREKTCEKPQLKHNPPFLFLRMLLFALGKWAAVAQLCSHQHFKTSHTHTNCTKLGLEKLSEAICCVTGLFFHSVKFNRPSNYKPCFTALIHLPHLFPCFY